MPNTPDSEEKYGTPDAENPEWTRERFKRAMRFKDLPPRLQEALLSLKKNGLVADPPKEPVTISLSPDVAEALRASGPEWEEHVDDLLREKFIDNAA